MSLKYCYFTSLIQVITFSFSILLFTSFLPSYSFCFSFHPFIHPSIHSFILIGNHRVLEVDPSQATAVVKRVFGSASGISGAAADGTTIDKMLLNRFGWRHWFLFLFDLFFSFDFIRFLWVCNFQFIPFCNYIHQHVYFLFNLISLSVCLSSDQ